ncbi:MAG: flagellar hook-associated protein 3 [Rhodocyclaceae bacterium]|nr:MAG: flagellar hook-associated protein 3 [Rhodocyclaceae bacterium]
MRVSTGMIFNAGSGGIQNRTSDLLRTQQQLSSGRRILTPSDDPVGAARALDLSQAQNINSSQASTRTDAKSALGLVDNQLGSVTDLLTRVKELAVQAGDAALSDLDKKSIATELRARFSELVGLANSTDGSGRYLFAGFQDSSRPFGGSVENGVLYGGDSGIRQLQVSSSRQLGISAPGDDIFMKIRNGNGTFQTGMQTAKTANTVAVSLASAAVTTAADWNDPVNSGALEARFWTDTAGGSVVTNGVGAGSVDLAAATAGPGLTITGGSNDQFTLRVNGGAAQTVTIPAATYNSAGALLTAIQGALPAGVTASLNGNNQLVVTSNTAGNGSSIQLGAVSGNTGYAALAGTPSYAQGSTSAPGSVFYDLVDTTTGNSLFSNSASTAGGAGNTFTHAYASGVPISLSGFNAAYTTGSGATGFGATMTFTGVPASGDVFSIARPQNGQIAVTPKTVAAWHADATIDKGLVNNPAAWQQSANSGNLEVRFWVDTVGGTTTQGQSVGTAVPIPAAATPPAPATPLTLTAANNQFNISLDGANPATTVTVPTGTYTTAASLVTAIQGVLPAGATVSLDASNHLVVTSSAAGFGSSVNLTAVGGNTGLATLFGTPAATAGVTAAPGTTFYDLVDATTGHSLFNGNASAAGGAGNTFNHVYVPGQAINIASAGGQGSPAEAAFNFGALVTVSGTPVTGDAFTIKASTDGLGNGYFLTGDKTAAAVNTGSAIVGTGEVLDVSKWNNPANSRNLEVRFWNDTSTTPNQMYYDLVDVTTEKSLFTNSTSVAGGAGTTYTHKFSPGDTINFSGLNIPVAGSPPTTVTDLGFSVKIDGPPASGDVFTIKPSTTQSVFDTIANLVTALEDPKPIGTTGNNYLTNMTGQALTNLGQAQDNVSKTRASVGSALNELDSLDSVGSNLDLQYQQALSGIQDLDYSKAITDLMRQQTELQAAQQSFAKISNLNLFNYL